MAGTGGYDLAAGWATSGLAYRLTPPGGEPPPQPAAFFDLQGSSAIAGAITTALFKRERTGQTSVVDVSLMNVGMWTMAPDIVGAPYSGPFTAPTRLEQGNPLVNWYRTADGRWLYLVLLQADRFWAELCGVIERPELIDDPRFVAAPVRYQNRADCVAALDAAFATRSLAEWEERFETFSGVWAPVLSFDELHHHRQVEANGYLPEVVSHEGHPFRLVAPAMQFDEVPTAPSGPAPETGQHTEEVLLDAGLSWDEIAQLRESGTLG